MSLANSLEAAPTAPQPDRSGSAVGASLTGFHRIAYADWGPVEARDAVVCLHGLTRQGRDFDFLASALVEQGRRVICPDLPGRGRSDRLASALHYTFHQHCLDAGTVMAAAGLAQVDWVGTSLGGMIGMMLAALPWRPIRRLVVNDIGPTVPADAVIHTGRRIMEMPRTFASLEEGAVYYKEAFAAYGELSDDSWTHIARYSLAWSEVAQCFRTLYDPNVTASYQLYAHYSWPLWPLWQSINIPVLILAGEKSTFLPADLAHQMQDCNRNAQLIFVPDVGHTPMFMQRDQIDLVLDFLSE